MNSPIHKIVLAAVILATSLRAGSPPDKAVASIASDHAIYEGSINLGFKTNDVYTDANFSIVAPLWSTLGTNGTLGGGALFLEPYSSWGEKGEIATSLGLGFRYLFNNQPISALRHPKKGQASFFEEGVAIGGSFFVDSLHTESDNDFWQLGVGAEIATRYVEFRGNYYIPQTGRKLAERKTFNETITKSQTTDRSVTSAGSPYDDGNGYLVQDLTTSILSTTQTTTTTLKHILSRYEEGMKGWDLEMALLVPYVDQWADVKLIGGYFHLENQPFGPQTGGTGPVKGWKAGVEVRPVPALAVTGMWYEDKRFLGVDWIVGARMEIPFEFGDIGDGKNFWSRIGDAFRPRRRHLVERLAEPVRRQNAAIKTGTSETQSTQQTGSQTHTNVQVISQSSQHIILGPGPSGTDFQYSTSGSLSVAAPDGNGGTSTQIVSGSLYINRIGNTLFVPTNGGSNLLFPSAPPLSNVQTVTPPTQHLTVSDNLFIGGASTLNSVITLSQQLTNPSLSNAVLNSGTLTISNPQTTGPGLIISGGTITGGANNSGGIPTGSGTLNLGGGSLVVSNPGNTGSVLSFNGQTGGTVINTGILPTLHIGSGSPFTFPTSSTASSVTFGNNVQIGGVSVPSGTYPITGGVITVGGAPVTLFGSTITAAP
jgi:hypothetical protein